MVVWNFIVGDHDIRWYSLSIRTISRKIIPIIKNWSSNGETTMLFYRNVSTIQNLLYLSKCLYYLFIKKYYNKIIIIKKLLK